MPPRTRKDTTWPVGVCAECFPDGPIPAAATSVGCPHGTWSRNDSAGE